MLSYSELKKGVLFVYDGQPHEVLDASFRRKQKQKAVMQTKVRNIITGKVTEKTWHASDQLEEAEVERGEAKFLYISKGEAWFCEPDNPGNRFSYPEEVFGDQLPFAKQNTIVETKSFKDKVISASLPIKMDLKVTEAPPNVKGNTAQGGTKPVVLETGATITVPMFIEDGDIVRVNTERGEYTERVQT